MTAKRKRARRSQVDGESASKKPRLESAQNLAGRETDHPTLRLYYARVQTLRSYVLSQIPGTAKRQRQKIAHLGKTGSGKSERSSLRYCTQEPAGAASCDSESAAALSSLLDSTLVCSTDPGPSERKEDHVKDFGTFSQQLPGTAGSSFGQGNVSQSELVDFAIWLLFHRVHRKAFRPPHLLCHGYQRAGGPRHIEEDSCAAAGVPGITSHYPNGNVRSLKGFPWRNLLPLLGKGGDGVMLDMLLKCGIFVALEDGSSNYYQLSGMPLTDRDPLIAGGARVSSSSLHNLQKTATKCLSKTTSSVAPRNPTGISFVRSRMFYARAAVNAKGKVAFGLRHIHALNRYRDSSSGNDTITLMKYIFPRQFGLHNVFTSTVDSTATTQRFKDYTLREQELACHKTGLTFSQDTELRQGRRMTKCQSLPRRMRGEPVKLIARLQMLHKKCSYTELFKHYCPPPDDVSCDSAAAFRHSLSLRNATAQRQTKSRAEASTSLSLETSAASGSNENLTNLATPCSHVSAYCRAVLGRIIPHGFWGDSSQGIENHSAVMASVDRFVKLRRFESLTLHTVLQGLKLNALTWLKPPKLRSPSAVSQSDTRKRREILSEFLYYIFDSILIPLIRSNFHVTESNSHQYQVFYFRHDIWRWLTEPVMAKLKLNMLEPVDTQKARKKLDARRLGYGRVRLLPKSKGLRPINNLRRRVTETKNGRLVVGRSVNSVMAPVLHVFDFERTKRPELMGSSILSPGGIYPRIKAFAKQLGFGAGSRRHLYFAKADAMSCFDTIPQRKVMKLMESIVTEQEYRIARHAEIKCSREHYRESAVERHGRPIRKFRATAKAKSDFKAFPDAVDATTKRNTIFVDKIVQERQGAEVMLDLLGEHVGRNIIKIGKRFFRQKTGIPQGSVLSSTLCSYFYADLERSYFNFLKDDESLFLRLIDDFLLITTNKSHATRFLQLMHDGIPSHGVVVNPDKSLANYDVSINGSRVPQQPPGLPFPYCGNAIDMQTLEITKDRNRRRQTTLANSLTVDLSKTPGRTFYRKALNAFKIQTHEMFLDTTLNRATTVLSTIYQNFLETAMKMHRYLTCMPHRAQPSNGILQGTVHDLLDLAFVLIRGKHKRHAARDYRCTVSKHQLRWLAGRAFRRIWGQKQTKYRELLVWLDAMSPGATSSELRDVGVLERIARRGDAVFANYRY